MNATVRLIDSPIVFGHPPRAPRPAWALYHDRMTDLSDVWVEEMDPQNETGAICTGFYTANAIPALDEQMRADFVTGFDLQGIAVETTEGTTYHDRAEILRMWGADTVWRVEVCEMEAAR